MNVTIPDDVKGEVTLSKRPTIKVTVSEKKENTDLTESKDKE